MKRKRLWSPFSRLKHPLRSDQTPSSDSVSDCDLSWIPDISFTALQALKESADLCPMLKTVTSICISILEVAERIKASKSQAFELARHCYKTLEVLADAVSDDAEIPPSMLDSIAMFEEVLRDAHRQLSLIAKRGRLSRLLHLNKDEGTFADLRDRLELVSRSFLIGSAARTEICVKQNQLQLARITDQMTDLQATTTVHRHIDLIHEKIELETKRRIRLAILQVSFQEGTGSSNRWLVLVGDNEQSLIRDTKQWNSIKPLDNMDGQIHPHCPEA